MLLLTKDKIINNGNYHGRRDENGTSWNCFGGYQSETGYRSKKAVGTKPVNPGETNTQITGMNIEDKVSGEGELYYDIIFYVKVPKEDNIIKMIINVEAQKDFHPGYQLETRAIFYAAREISAQKHTEFEKSDYNSIKKVYSIWICMNAPQYIGNAISEYSFVKKDFIPGIPDRPDAYDKMVVVMIALNEEINSEDKFINFMNILISERISVEEKKKRLEEYGFVVSSEMKGGLNIMCNYSDMMLDKGDERRQKKTARLMLKEKIYSYTQIAKMTELSIEEVKKIEEEMLEYRP